MQLQKRGCSGCVHPCRRTRTTGADASRRGPAQAAGLTPGGRVSRPDGGEASAKQALSANRLASFLEPTTLVLGFLRIYPIISVLKFFEAKEDTS